MEPATALRTADHARTGRWLIAAAGFVLAFLVRLVPMLRGGGLTGYGSYDDSVYYAAAIGLVHGVLPYRDFLLLQPPGIVVLLAPFAALGRLIGEGGGFALSRLAWMAMGGVTTALITLVLGRFGRTAAAIGGACYALFWPAALVERVTDQEAPQNLLLVVATVLLLGGVRRVDGAADHGRVQTVGTVVAGAALGLALGVKIWAVVPIAVWTIWLLRRRGLGRAVLLLAVALGTGALVYLPFFLNAPAAMWRMVVGDQLGRRRIGGWTERLAIITGTTPLPGPRPAVVAAAVVGLAVALLLAWRLRALRPIVVIHLLLTVVLLAAPPTFIHYGALLGPTTALVVGGAVGVLVLGAVAPSAGAVATGAARVVAVVAVAAVLVALVVMAAAQAGHRYTHRLDVARIGPLVHPARGCVTFDSPSPAIGLGVVGQNLERGCPLVVDLGGTSYEPGLRLGKSRAHNRAWQRYSLGYLRSGRVVLISRFRRGFGFSPATAQQVRGWPLLTREGPLAVRRPHG